MRKISVIIFCHNVASYIDQCMVSVTTQTIGLDNLEIICVDDASSDDTWTHLQKWEQLFSEQVLLIPMEMECGQEMAENIALQYASGDWIAFIDAKHFLDLDQFERLYKAAENGVVTALEGLVRREALLGQLSLFPENRKMKTLTEQRLRIVQFYSETESFNFFTDRLAEELLKRGHEVFICDLDDISCKTEHSYDHLNRFLEKKVDVVICFDGIGTREEQFIRQWDKHGAVVLDILMDPPFRFHPTLERHPKEYILFCCDKEHVEYVKKYFPEEVPNVIFMPHVGSVIEEKGPTIPYKDRKYDILFSASYLHPQSQMEKIKDLFPGQPDVWRFYWQMFEDLVTDSSLTIEKAVLGTLQKFDLSISDEMLKMLLNRSLYVDWAIRMYHRGRVVMALAEAGLDLYLLGPGWEDHPSASYRNVHRLDAMVPYRQTLTFMGDARINLNVMPWFKAGTHDRIFNTLLQHSLPFTDPSSWIIDNFTDGEDIVLYELDHLEQLPELVNQFLTDIARAEEIIQKGYSKVRRDLTWSNCADWIIGAADQIRGKMPRSGRGEE